MSSARRRASHDGEPSTREGPTVELLWFSDCPNHEAARHLVHELIDRHAPGASLLDIDATDPTVATAQRFPGSPTIRVNGIDVDPGFVDPGDYTPRCRLYRTALGLRGVPERDWVESALVTAVERSTGSGSAGDGPATGD